MKSTLSKVMKIVSEEYGQKMSDLTPDTRLVEDHLPVDLVLTLLACEEKFDIDIPDEEAEKLVTIGLLAAYIDSRLHPDKTVWPPAPRDDARK